MHSVCVCECVCIKCVNVYIVRVARGYICMWGCECVCLRGVTLVLKKYLTPLWFSLLYGIKVYSNEHPPVLCETILMVFGTRVYVSMGVH